MHAHIVGIPMEETALALMPVAAAALAGILAARARVARYVRSLFGVGVEAGNR